MCMGELVVFSNDITELRQGGFTECCQLTNFPPWTPGIHQANVLNPNP